MLNSDLMPETKHNNNPVPFLAVDRKYFGKKGVLKNGTLADVTPTLLAIMDVKKPKVMTGKSLIKI